MKYIEIIEYVQIRATKLVLSVSHLSYSGSNSKVESVNIESHISKAEIVEVLKNTYDIMT